MSRKWLSVLALAVVLLVGWNAVIVLQSTTTAQPTPQPAWPTTNSPNPFTPSRLDNVATFEETVAGPTDDVNQFATELSQQIQKLLQIKEQLAHQQAVIEQKRDALNKQIEQLNRGMVGDRYRQDRYRQGSGSSTEKMMTGGRGGMSLGRGELAFNNLLPVGSRITWEYKSGTYGDSNANALGKEGWELVSVYVRPDGNAEAVYKRPAEASASQPFVDPATQIQRQAAPRGNTLFVPAPAESSETESTPANDAAEDLFGPTSE